MTDRELLELAAKSMQAARHPCFANFDVCDEKVGVRLELGSRRGAITSYWNPLLDGTDALGLAVAHGIEVSFHHDLDQALAVVPGSARGCGEYWHSGEPMEATCRAIVHAAAAIQLAKQQVTALTQRLDMANRLNTDARNQLAQLSARQAAPDGWRIALERIADPRNTHFAGDAQLVARDALSAAPKQEGST